MHVRMRRCLQGQLTLDVSQVFAFVSRVVRSTEVYMFEGLYDAQNVAIICNAMARIDFNDQPMLLHLSLIVQQMHPDQFDVQAVSNIVNAFVKLEVDLEVSSSTHRPPEPLTPESST